MSGVCSSRSERLASDDAELLEGSERVIVDSALWMRQLPWESPVLETLGAE
ncbi:hypothetical protein [Natrialba chahannaoensis]|uniref:hypothetical protein n=1 Tax=Natrialba chahannaoensis TaxID=68911 RepID=UPI001375C8B2|nr:hypothetical protein [Natrialba chahannaoensis]